MTKSNATTKPAVEPTARDAANAIAAMKAAATSKVITKSGSGKLVGTYRVINAGDKWLAVFNALPGQAALLAQEMMNRMDDDSGLITVTLEDEALINQAVIYESTVNGSESLYWPFLLGNTWPTKRMSQARTALMPNRQFAMFERVS